MLNPLKPVIRSFFSVAVYLIASFAHGGEDDYAGGGTEVAATVAPTIAKQNASEGGTKPAPANTLQAGTSPAGQEAKPDASAADAYGPQDRNLDDPATAANEELAALDNDPDVVYTDPSGTDEVGGNEPSPWIPSQTDDYGSKQADVEPVPALKPEESHADQVTEETEKKVLPSEKLKKEKNFPNQLDDYNPQKPLVKPGKEGETEQPAEPGKEGEKEQPTEPGTGGGTDHPAEPGKEGEEEQPAEPSEGGGTEHPAEPGKEGEKEQPAEPGTGGGTEHPAEPGKEGEKEQPAEPGIGGGTEHPAEPGKEGEKEQPTEPSTGGGTDQPAKPTPEQPTSPSTPAPEQPVGPNTPMPQQQSQQITPSVSEFSDRRRFEPESPESITMNTDGSPSEGSAFRQPTQSTQGNPASASMGSQTPSGRAPSQRTPNFSGEDLNDQEAGLGSEKSDTYGGSQSSSKPALEEGIRPEDLPWPDEGDGSSLSTSPSTRKIASQGEGRSDSSQGFVSGEDQVNAGLENLTGSSSSVSRSSHAVEAVQKRNPSSSQPISRFTENQTQEAGILPSRSSAPLAQAPASKGVTSRVAQKSADGTEGLPRLADHFTSVKPTQPPQSGIVQRPVLTSGEPIRGGEQFSPSSVQPSQRATIPEPSSSSALPKQQGFWEQVESPSSPVASSVSQGPENAHTLLDEALEASKGESAPVAPAPQGSSLLDSPFTRALSFVKNLV